MVTTIYLIRHGESLGNIQKRFLGHSDWDLTELGYLQARCTAAEFEHIPVDFIVSSDLLRAYHTAQPIAEMKQLCIQPDPEFREIYAGLWEGESFADLEVKYPQDYEIWKKDIGRAVATGGESVLQLHRRVYAALQRIVSEHEGKHIVIATHATPIRVLLTGFAGLPIEEAAQIPWASNASITKLIYKNGEFRVEYADRNEHLGTLSTRLPANV